MDDSRIIQLYWDRNQSAIPATADKYGKYCLKIAMNILGNHQDAEECVNDTYLNAWNSMPPHRPDMLQTFLGKITRNLSLNRYRRNSAEKRGSGELPAVLDEIGEFVSGHNNVEQDLDHRELVDALNDFLAALSPKKRSIFVSRYWHTESVSDIAIRYNMSADAVSVTLNRLRTKLHNYLSERGFEL